jgi:hypothetical protein
VAEVDPIAQAQWQGETSATLRSLVATVDQMAKDQATANVRREQLDSHILGEINRVELEGRARVAALERQHAEWKGNLRGFLIGATTIGGGVGGSIVAAAIKLLA